MSMSKEQNKLSGKDKEGRKVMNKAEISRKFKVMGEGAEKDNHVDRSHDQKSKNGKFVFSEDFLGLRSPKDFVDEWEMGSKDDANFGSSRINGKMDDSKALAESNERELEMAVKRHSEIGKSKVQRSAV